MQRGGSRGGGFRGGGRSFGGGGRAGGGRGFGGGRGGGRGFQDYGPPSEVTEAGIFEHPCEGEAVCKLSIDKVSICNQRQRCALCHTSTLCSKGSERCPQLHLIMKQGTILFAGSLLQCSHLPSKQDTDWPNRRDLWWYHQHSECPAQPGSATTWRSCSMHCHIQHHVMPVAYHVCSMAKMYCPF